MSALAGELLGLLFTEQPVQATLIGVHEHDERLPELDESARQLMRERAGQLADRARDLLASGLPEQDRITAALVVQQAEALVSRIEFPLIDHVVASPLSACALKLLLVLPLIGPPTSPSSVPTWPGSRPCPRPWARWRIGSGKPSRGGTPRWRAWCAPRSERSTGTWTTPATTRCAGRSWRITWCPNGNSC